MDREAIKAILPHREPMLLLDEVELQGDKAVGHYTVRGDEFFLQGHFPGRPIVPGVLLCEMMAQTACLLIQAPVGSFMTYYTGLDHVKFKKPVLPGETIVLESQLTAQRGVFYFVQSQGTVDGKLCVSGELSFAVIAEA